MRLKLTRDTGNLIVGEMISDKGEAAISPLVVAVAGGKQVTLQAKVRKPGKKKNAKRGKGKAIVRVDEDIFPGLKQADDLEIRETTTGTVLYRRLSSPRHVQAKLFWYRLSPMPDEKIEAKAKEHFSAIHTAIEGLPTPKLSELISDRSARSVFMIGRPPLRSYLDLLRSNNFYIVTVLRDPYEELAERILFMNLIAEKKAVSYYSDRLTKLRPLLKLAKQVDVRDPANSLRLFDKLEQGQRRVLSDPLTIALGCKPGELPSKRHIATALDSLATMDLVGLRTRFNDFKTCLAELLDVDILGDYRPSDIIDQTAIQLKKIPQFDRLISLDLELFAHASEAIEEALSTITAELDVGPSTS